LQRRHAFGDDRPDERPGVAVQARPRHHQPRPDAEREEELPDRGVEPVGRLLEEDVVGGEGEAVRRPQDAVDDGAVRDGHPLRPPRRARRVDDVGQVPRQRPGAGALGRERGEQRRRLGRVERDDLGGGESSELRAREQRGLGEEDGGPGVGHHEAEAVGRVGGVEREVGRTRLECAEDGDDHLRRALQEEADDRLGAGAERAQVMGEPVGALVKLGVGQLLALEAEGDRGGGEGRLPLEEMVQARLRVVPRRRVVPVEE
jgi:hypothetical protein